MRQLLITAGLLLPLALDTFALAAALGVAGLQRRDRLRVSLVFTAFEAGMPIAGLQQAGADLELLRGDFEAAALPLEVFLRGLDAEPALQRSA